MKPFHLKDALYAYTSTAKLKKVQTIPIYLDFLDNVPQHFWSSFIDALAVWKVQFAQTEKQIEFPAKTGEKILFINRFHKQLELTPLVIIFHNFHQITNGLVREFLIDLLNIPIQNLNVLLLHNETNIQKEKKDSISYLYHYLSKQEEWDFYQKQIKLSEEQMDKIRTFTNGWIGAVKNIAKYLLSDGIQILDNLEQNIIYSCEFFFLNEWTAEQQEWIVKMSLLGEFPLELIRDLEDDRKDNLPDLLQNTPYLRYNLETKHYYFVDYFKPHLQKRQVLLGNRQKEQFYVSVGTWYKECGDKIMAINCYRKAHDYKKSIQVIQQWTFPNSAKTASCYLEAINEMPAVLLDKHPLLHVIRCYMLNTLYRYEDSYKLLKAFCCQNDQGEDTLPELAPILGEAYLLLGSTAIRVCIDIWESYSYYKQAAALLPNGSVLIRGNINLYADVPAARLTSPKEGSLRTYLNYMFRCEPYVSKVTGGGLSGCAYLAAAETNYYTRNFKLVEPNIQKAIHAGIKTNQTDIICSAYFLSVRYNMAKGNYDRMMESYKLLIQYANTANYDTFFSMPDLAKGWLMLSIGKTNEVAGWIRSESQYQNTIKPWNYGRDRLIRCYFMLHNQQFEELIAYAQVSGKLMYDRGLHLLRIHLLMMEAVAYHKLGELDLSVRAFEEVYKWTHQNQIVMPIIEYGKLVRPLIENCQKAENCVIPDEWLNLIEKKANSYYTYQHNILKKYEREHTEYSNVLDNLTIKEQELLLLISRGITLKTIAEMQGKTISAVKAMCRRVYSKLDVNNRANAVRIATMYEIEKFVRYEDD